MCEWKLVTPVVLIIFNRMDCAKQVLEQIKKVKPEKLYIVSDGPRADRPGEEELVLNTRKYVESNIDWECDVKCNYAEYNIGCKYRVTSGIDWVFEQEEKAIILEDDCVPSVQFFRFCQEMLEMYEEDERVWLVAGINTLRKQASADPYFFSKFADIWGWATWRRAWKQIDLELDTWPEVKKNKSIRYAYDFFSYRCFKRIASYQGRANKNTWDVAWLYTILCHHGVSIVPRDNMVQNIGCGREDATQTVSCVKDDFSYGNTISFPLKKKKTIEPDEQYDRELLKLRMGIKKEMKYIKYLCRRVIPKLKEKLGKGK